VGDEQHRSGGVVVAVDPSLADTCCHEPGAVEPPAGDDRGVLAEADQLAFVVGDGDVADDALLGIEDDARR
jgi:hypothetical protein